MYTIYTPHNLQTVFFTYMRTDLHVYMYITKLIKRIYRVSFGNSIFEYGTQKMFVI